jgi:hypothetical protein
LTDISALDLLALSGSIVALGAAIAGFGAGAAAAGIGNFVGGLFSSLSGQKSPIEQLISIGEQASNIDRVVSSIGTLKNSLASFGDIKANLDPLKQFVDIINSTSLVKLAAVTAALAITAPNVAFAEASTRPTVSAPSYEEIEKGSSVTGSIQAPVIQTDAGLAVPVSIVPVKVESTAVQELTKLNENIQNVATTPESNAPILQVYTDGLKNVSDRLEELIASIRPMLETTGSGGGIVATNQNNTIMSSSPVINTNGNAETARDVPYIERNKYRQTAMYTRGLL